MGLVLQTLSVLIGLFFIFVGITKVSMYPSEDLYKDARKEYIRFAKILPLMSKSITYKLIADVYRKSIAWTEIIGGICLSFVPIASIKRWANILLLLSLIIKLAFQYITNSELERMAPVLVFTFMLMGRLVIEWQEKRDILQLKNLTVEQNEKARPKQE